MQDQHALRNKKIQLSVRFVHKNRKQETESEWKDKENEFNPGCTIIFAHIFLLLSLFLSGLVSRCEYLIENMAHTNLKHHIRTITNHMLLDFSSFISLFFLSFFLFSVCIRNLHLFIIYTITKFEVNGKICGNTLMSLTFLLKKLSCCTLIEISVAFVCFFSLAYFGDGNCNSMVYR